MKCSVCKKELVIVIYPDFSSSGIWCKNCGVCFFDPKEEFFPFVPSRLFDLIEGWVWLWEDLYERRNHLGNKEYCVNLIMNMQMELKDQLNKYIPCEVKTFDKLDLYREPSYKDEG